MSEYAKREFLSIVNSIKAYLRSEEAGGMVDLLSPAVANCAAQETKGSSKTQMLTTVRNEALKCRGCLLYKTRNNLVFGDGDPDAKLLFVGEAPGFEEDREGAPFVGQAGKLLTKMIEAMGFSRSEVYICNVLKCRPPENRSPLPEEADVCKKFLLRQIEIISPKAICCLGKHAASTLLKTQAPISKMRGREFDFHGIPLIPTFHPAYLLRNPDAKKDVWEDLKKIRRIISED